MKRRVTRTICIYVISVFLFCGCYLFIEECFALKTPALANPNYHRPENAVLQPVFCKYDMIERTDKGLSAAIDLAHLSQGYIVVACSSPVSTRIKISNENGQEAIYVVQTNGELQNFPLVMGNGVYNFTLYTHIEDTLYNSFLNTSRTVVLESELTPFVMPSAMVKFREECAVTSLARELAKNCSNDLEVVQQIYYWIQRNMSYDYDKAEQVKGKPLLEYPDPEQILQQRKGVCLDFSVLMAAMLRVNGIPCKVEHVVVELQNSHEKALHAWNMVWLPEEGKIANQVYANPGSWTRLDMTLSISGQSTNKVYKEDAEHFIKLQY